ncbi:MAG: mechanosensitive ion channel family protein [Rhodoferax sp.]
MRRLLAAVLLVFAIGSALAQDKPAEAPPEASVLFANRTLTVLRVPFLGVSPERRARRAEAVLKEIAAGLGEGKITVQVEPQGHALLVDGELALILTPGDADPLRAQTLAQASQAARAALQRALAETREGRDLQRLLRGALNSLLVTLIAIALAALTWRARGWASARLAAQVARHAARVRVAGAELLHTERLVAIVGLGLRSLSVVVVAFVAYEWLSFVLSQFPYTRPWGEGLTAFLMGIATNLGRGVLQSLPDLVIAIVIFLIARGVIGMFRPFFTRVANGTTKGGWLDADTARPTQRLFSVAVGLFAVVMAYPYLPGAGSDAFKGMSVLIGLMVSVGGSSLFSQAASGLVLMYSRTLRVGEYVRIGEHEGTVTETGSFTTRIRTGLGEELTLPNALVLGTVTKNYSRVMQGSGFVVDTVVTIGYDTPWRQVEAMLIEAANRTIGVRADPAPRVFQTALTDFYPEYRLVCLAGPSQPLQRAQVLSALHANIQDVFNEYGVQIMSPHYLGDPATAKVVPPQAWYTAPARDPQAQENKGTP